MSLRSEQATHTNLSLHALRTDVRSTRRIQRQPRRRSCRPWNAAGIRDFYSLLAEKTEEHGTINVYEEVPNWTFSTFLSHLHGIIPDLRYGSEFDINRYVAVGDSVWAKLLFDWWRAIRRIWPVAPAQMGYFDVEDSEVAITWDGRARRSE